MDEELRVLLETIAPAWRQRIRGEPDVAISYTCYLERDEEHEAGMPIREHVYYRINLFQRRLDSRQRKELVNALRGAGWAIGERTETEDEQNRYYQYVIEISKRRDFNE